MRLNELSAAQAILNALQPTFPRQCYGAGRSHSFAKFAIAYAFLFSLIVGERSDEPRRFLFGRQSSVGRKLVNDIGQLLAKLT